MRTTRGRWRLAGIPRISIVTHAFRGYDLGNNLGDRPAAVYAGCSYLYFLPQGGPKCSLS